MAFFSNEEKTDMFVVYIRNQRNPLAALREYTALYPERRLPHRTLFAKLERSLRQNGSFSIKPRKRNRRHDDNREIGVVAAVVADPYTSTRKIASEGDVPKSTVSLYLRRNKMHPYKVLSVQHLIVPDFEKRRVFCRWFSRKLNVTPTLPINILWSDESKFTNCGMFNRRNFHYYADENPRVISARRFQQRFSVNVWCGMIGGTLVGPYFFNHTLNGQLYLEFLQQSLQDFLDNLPLGVTRQIHYFQHDGAPPHNFRAVCEFLDNAYPHRWIGNRGPTDLCILQRQLSADNCCAAWPPRSPDLNPLDYFLWGYIKDIVYARTYNDLQDLQNSIQQVCDGLSPAVLESACRDIVRRTQICIRQNGGHFEQLEREL